MDKIEWIFFDVGGVLLDDNLYESLRLEILTKIIRIFDSSVSRYNIIESMPKASAMPGILNDNILNLFLRDKQKLYMAKNLLASRKIDLREALDKSQLRPDAESVLSKLCKTYRLGLMANQPKSTKELLNACGISKYLSHALVSDDHGFRKPDLRYFQAVLNECNVNAKNAVLIDNNIERGLFPAKKLGMITIWFHAVDKPNVENKSIDYQIKNLSDLLKIFKTN